MTAKAEHIRNSLDHLSNELKRFVDFFERGLDYDRMVYKYWNAKDVLGHITFWHESFARNISDLGQNIKPRPLKGKLSEVNRQSVESTRNESLECLIKRLTEAQNTIEQNVFLDHVNMVPYKKGSRDFSKLEHLEVVSNHIHKHLKDISKEYGSTQG